MGQFSKVLLAIDKVNTVSQMALDCRSVLGWLDQFSGPNHSTLFRLSVANISTSLPDVQIGISMIS